MSGKAVFIYHPALEDYRFKPEHPFNPSRLQTTVSLLKMMGLIKDEEMVEPRHATMEELLLAHDEEYIKMVQELSKESCSSMNSPSFGIGTEDNPVFTGMHDAASLVVGATLQAGELVMQGRALHAVSIAGGLHHACKRQASGFCIYNDINVAIRKLCREHHIRVVYLDMDAHHGDGVQQEFYEDPNVLTISFHENGRFLFPGTGNLHERGRKEGFGYCINVPLEPFTEDESFIACFREVVPALLDAFQPDLIISQNGCDGHFYDSMTHMSLTMNAFREIPRLVHELAHTFTGGKWVAVGGGGYDPFRVVPRAWVLLWGEAAGVPVSNCLPQCWLEQWQTASPFPLPGTLMDLPDTFFSTPRREEIAEKNLVTARKALQDAMIVFNKFI